MFKFIMSLGWLLTSLAGLSGARTGATRATRATEARGAKPARSPLAGAPFSVYEIAVLMR